MRNYAQYGQFLKVYVRRWYWRWRCKQLREKIEIWIAWHMPRKLVMWAAIRLMTAASPGNPGDMTCEQVLKDWDCK